MPESDGCDRAAKLDEITTRLSGLPGVEGVTVAVAPPFGGRITIDSLPGLPHIYRNAVASSYFKVMNLQAVRGRVFAPEDEGVMIVSESAARAVWPNQVEFVTIRKQAEKRAYQTFIARSGDGRATLEARQR